MNSQSTELFNYDEDVLINSIELVNFMCHDHLIVRFNKKFTCIGGRNGSGKSAIMISLGILFGLRSGALDKGNSLKNFIKTGEVFFIIRCVINNTKKFMFDTFGDVIILEKKVTMKYNCFTVSTKEKKTIFNRIEDLEYLLDFYNLKFDNPMNFLTQEMAKRFLSSSDPKVLYNLFLKGTEISDIREINEDYKRNVEVMKDKIKQVESELEKIKIKIEDENKRINILNNIEDLKRQVEECENELKWSKLNKVKRNALDILENIENLDEEVKIKQDLITKLMEESQEVVKAKGDLNNENKILQERNKNRLEQIENEISSLEIKIRSIENDLIEIENELKYKKDLIEKFELSNTFVDKRDELSSEKKQLESRINVLRDSLENVKYALERAEKQKNKEIDEIKTYDKKLYQLKKQLEYLNKSGGEIKLHSKINEIEKEIKSTNFKDSVFGPIGNYIKVKETKWSKVVSIITNNVLTDFVCFNSQDRDVLHGILRKFGVGFRVLIPSNRMNSILDYTANPNYKTVVDVISVSSTLIFNQLIILLAIERIILIENREKAYSVMRQSPQNVDSVYLPNGDIIKKIGGSLSDFSSKTLDKYYFENELERKKELQRQMNDLLSNKPSTQSTQEYGKLKNKRDGLNLEKDDLTKKLTKIEREIENADSLFETQKEILANENIYEEKKHIEFQIGALKRKTNKMKETTISLNEEKNLIKNTTYKSVSDLDKQLFEKQTKLNRVNQEINNIIVKKLGLDKEHRNKMADFETQRLALLEILKEVEDPRDEKIVDNTINKLNIEIGEIKKIGDLNESHQSLEKLNNLREEKENFLAVFETKVKDLYDSFNERVKKREELKNLISEKAIVKFKEITFERGYKGQLVFDHQKEELILQMEVHNSGIAGSKETLSGGERSFAAMCFLLSLWPHVSCPVKVLDEFDVFMDNLNRKFIIEKFKEYFLNSRNQVILITPLNTNDLVCDEIDIISLKAPERKSIN